MEPNPPAIVGEAVAGQAAKVTAEINAIISNVNAGTFDLIPLLHEAKSKQYYLPLGFDTFGQYAKSLDLKVTKSYYLAKIGEVMDGASITRAEYEPLGIAKLRVIARLDLYDKEGKALTYNNGEGDEFTRAECVQSLVSTGKDTSLEDIEKVVAKLQGKTGDDEMVWVNIVVKKVVREQVIDPALSLAKMNIGTTGTDSDGVAIEASDGRALEVLAAEYLADLANGAEQVAPVKEIVVDGEAVGGPEFDSSEGV
jgi:hypothetical protein